MVASTGADMKEDLFYQLALSMIPGIGGVTAKKLIACCGGAEAVFREKPGQLRRIPGIGEAIAATVKKADVFDQAEKEIGFIQKHGIRVLYYTDNDYPYRLKQCDDGPILLFIKGGPDLNKEKVVGIVGTRSITDYGRKKCKEFVADLSKHEPLIISGLAYGVDACAHQAALENGLETLAVLGHGLDRIYPPLHTGLAKNIIKQGALVSDFISGTKPDRENFPKRNRIIAGLCDVIIVVEAAVTGGALITATIANSYNREVFALPGRTSDPYSMGCNRLIKHLKAGLIESVADIEYALNWQAQAETKTTQRPLFVELKPEEKVIADILRDHAQASIDQLVKQSGFAPGKTAAILLNLEFMEVVSQLPGKCFRLNNTHYS